MTLVNRTTLTMKYATNGDKYIITVSCVATIYAIGLHANAHVGLLKIEILYHETACRQNTEKLTSVIFVKFCRPIIIVV